MERLSPETPHVAVGSDDLVQPPLAFAGRVQGADPFDKPFPVGARPIEVRNPADRRRTPGLPLSPLLQGELLVDPLELQFRDPGELLRASTLVGEIPAPQPSVLASPSGQSRLDASS